MWCSCSSLTYQFNLCLHQLPEFLENIKTKKFVLVHGEGFGAWCWYKNIALLEESGLLPIALDLAGSGINTRDANNVTTLADYSKPLLDFLQNLPEDEKVKPFGLSVQSLGISFLLSFLTRDIFAGNISWPQYWRRLHFVRVREFSRKNLESCLPLWYNDFWWAKTFRRVCWRGVLNLGFQSSYKVVVIIFSSFFNDVSSCVARFCWNIFSRVKVFNLWKW